MFAGLVGCHHGESAQGRANDTASETAALGSHGGLLKVTTPPSRLLLALLGAFAHVPGSRVQGPAGKISALRVWASGEVTDCHTLYPMGVTLSLASRGTGIKPSSATGPQASYSNPLNLHLLACQMGMI